MNTKVKRVYEEIADKTLSRGVLWSNPNQEHKYIFEYISESKKKGERSIMFYHTDGSIGDYRGGEIKILGHPLHYGYIVDWIEKNIGFDTNIFGNLMIYWKDKTKLMEDQSLECIEYVHDLILKK